MTKPAKKRVNNVELNVDEENTKKDEPKSARKSSRNGRSVPKRKKYYYDSLPEEEKVQHDKLVLHNNKILKEMSDLR